MPKILSLLLKIPPEAWDAIFPQGPDKTLRSPKGQLYLALVFIELAAVIEADAIREPMKKLAFELAQQLLSKTIEFN
jgi:hypothetical protein